MYFVERLSRAPRRVFCITAFDDIRACHVAWCCYRGSPPSEVIRRRLKAAPIVLRATAGRSKGSGISSSISGWRSKGKSCRTFAFHYVRLTSETVR